MNRNYRSAPSSPNRTRNLSLVKKLFSFNKLVQFKIVSTSFLDKKGDFSVCQERKLIKDLISSSLPSGFDFGQKWCAAALNGKDRLLFLAS